MQCFKKGKNAEIRDDKAAENAKKYNKNEKI